MTSANSDLIKVLKNLVSESQNPATLDIDLKDSTGIVQAIHDADKEVSQAIERVLPDIAKAVDLIVKAVSAGGRLVYIGAGTSGRMGVLDAVECVPTFSVSDDLVVGVMAGGEPAMFKAQEGVEDQPDSGVADLKAIHFRQDDILVGIAASGRTPYVLGAMAYGRQLGANTIALSCNPNASIALDADIAILPVVGPEVLTGSTRMKAGTAQKLVLNMLSTATMIRLGKTYRNLMVDLKVTNDKLMARGTRIVMDVTGVAQQQAEQALQQANGQVKAAIYMLMTDTSFSEATEDLDAVDGFLRKALINRGISC
jgi:N-acetylmuramic acid 6-phosphate etherase